MSTVRQSIPSGYKYSEVGIIPDDWEGDKLARYWNVTDCKHVTAKFIDNGYPIVSIQEVQCRFVDLSEAYQTTLQFFTLLRAGGRRPRAGDLILSRNATVGEVAQVAEWHPQFAMGQDVCLLRKTNQNYSTGFLQAVFQSSVVAHQLADSMVGSTFKRVNVEQIKKLVVPMPPIAEQQAIAEALGDADAWIESLEGLIAKKRHLKQAAMQQLLTGKTRLPGFEGEWEVKRLDNCFSISGGLSASRDQLSHVGHCYLHYGDIHGSSKTFIDVDAEYQQIPKLEVPLNAVSPASLLGDGDVVFVDASEDIEGTNKHVVIVNPHNVPFISGLHTIVAKPKGNRLNSLYCRYCFQTEAVKSQFRFFAVGTKVSGVSKTSIAKIEILVPKPNEQLAIADVLTDMDNEITALEAKLSKARQIKQGMMQELLTGRIRLV